MKKTWIMIAMLAAFSCACDDDSKDDSCVNGTRICNGSGVRAECVDGEYVDIPCSAGSVCDNGACKQVGDNCSNAMLAIPGADGRSISYCVNGRQVTESCPDGFTVMNGSHGAYCQAPANPAVVDNSACNSNGAQRCSASGVHQVCNGTKWVDQPCTTNADEASAWKCESGECVHYTVCYEGLLSCDGTTVLKCAKGAKENLWKKDVDCAADGKVCKAGKCVAASSSSSERYQDCDAFGCQVEGGKACSAICQEEEGTSKCYVDTEAMEFGCGDMPSGDNPSGSGYEDCSDEDCKMSDGSKVKCGEACVSMAGAGNKAWCDAQGNVQCSPTEPGGSSSGGSGDDTLYDCTDESRENQKLGEYCAAKYGSDTNKALCAECTDEFLCATAAQLAQANGKSAASVGVTDMCGSSSGGNSDYVDCDEYGCVMDDAGTKCSDYCKSQGESGCYVDPAAKKFGCGEMPSGGSSSGGDSCDEKTYKESCNGNIGLYCYEGEETEFKCDSSAPCAVSAASGIADCAQTCKAGDADSVYCYSYGGSVFAIPMHCEKTTTGSYGYFLDSEKYTPCTNGCTDGVGCK